MGDFSSAVRQTLRTILTDYGLLPIFLLAIPMYSFYYPAAYSSEAVRDIPIEVVDLDHSPMSRQIVRDILAAPSVRLIDNPASIESARRDMADQRCAGVAIIPEHFERDVLRGTPTVVETWGTGAYPTQDKAVLEAVGGVVQSFAQQAAVVRMVRQGAPTAYARQGDPRSPAYIEQNLFNITRGYGSYVVAAVAVLIVQQLLLIGTAALCGTWIEQRSGPLYRGQPPSLHAFAGVWLTCSLFAWISFLYMFGFSFWYQDYPRGGNLAGMAAFAAVLSLAISAMGLALGALLGNRERPLQVIIVTSLPMLFISGATYPPEAIPAGLRGLGALIPTTPGINGFLKFNQMAASWHEAAPEIAHAAILALAYAILAWLATRRRAALIPPCA